MILLALFLPLGCLGSYGGYDGDDCGIYPPCHQYGEGAWQILEDCHRYINCTRPVPGHGGELLQQNMECPGDLVFTNEYGDKPGEGECIEFDKATECKNFQEGPCVYSCPRLYLSSNGTAFDYQYRRIGCFRISGTLFGATLVHYQNQNGQYLTPDAMSNPMTINWIVSESPGAFNGGIKNNKFDYVRCPFDDWNRGWEADIGQGHWAVDETMKLTCHKGDEGASSDAPPVTTSTTDAPPVTTSTTDAPPVTTTTTDAPTVTTTTTDAPPVTTTTTDAPPVTTSTTAPTSPPQYCNEEGPNPIAECVGDFVCCNYDDWDNTWKELACSCDDDFVFGEAFHILACLPELMCSRGSMPWGYRLEDMDHGRYTCEGGVKCIGM